MRHMLGKALLICALPFGAAAAGPHDPLATYMVEAIPFALKDGKSMDDMMALRDDFAKLAEAGDLEYSAYVMSPHFMSQSSLPVDEKFDAVWLGFSRNPSTLAASLSAYLESGAEMEQAFGEVRGNESAVADERRTGPSKRRSGRRRPWLRLFFNLPPKGWGQPDEPPGSGKGLVRSHGKGRRLSQFSYLVCRARYSRCASGRDDQGTNL